MHLTAINVPAATFQATVAVHRLHPLRSIAVATNAPDPGATAAHLVHLYRPVLGESLTSTHLKGRSGASLLIVGQQPPQIASGDVVVWGRPVGSRGDATDAEVTAHVTAPSATDGFSGVYCLLHAGEEPAVVTSAAAVHVMKHTEWNGVFAYATRGVASLVASGRPIRLIEARVPELVLFDFVIGEDELLDGVRILPEASRVQLRNPPTENSWWPTHERLGSGPPTDAASLRAAVIETVRPMVQLDSVALGLTAGRDSSLVASCLSEANERVATFTFGRRTADAVGAERLAQDLGFDHESVGAPPEGGFDVVRLVEWAVWSEGLDPPSNLLYGSATIPFRPFVWMSGSGGETGRSFYRHLVEDPMNDQVAIRLDGRGLLPSDVRAQTEERIAAQVDLARAETHRRSPDLIDVFYLRNRMRNWLYRHAPYPEVLGWLPVFVEPRLARALLDIPVEDRLSSACFDEALGNHRPPPPPRRPQILQKLQRRNPMSQDARTLRDLRRLHDQLTDHNVARRVLGERWWQFAYEGARWDPTFRRQLWNAAAVSVLDRWLSTAAPK